MRDVHLTFSDLRRFNVMRCIRWFPGGVSDWSLSDWACALAGELGEACNIVKKLNRARDGVVGNSKSEWELREDLADELGDTLIYLDLLAARAGIDLAKAVERVFNRTSIKNGFPDRIFAVWESDR